MPVVIDATVGGTAANSYVTAIEADAILMALPYRYGWDAADADWRNEALVYAVKEIEREYKFKGTRTYDDQARDWPRDGLYDKYGREVAEDSHPEDVKLAQCQVADLILAGDRESETGSMAGIRRLRVGPIEIELQNGFYGTIGRSAIIPRYIRALLDQYAETSSTEWTIPILRA
jgi:hypothetical protein